MQNHYGGNKKERSALKTYVTLMRAAESVTHRIHQHLSSTGLTLSQFAALEALYHLGPLSQKEIGKKILRSSGNITMVIDNLEKRGLVQRKRHTVDRRYFIVHLTSQGKKLIGDIFPRHAAVIATEMAVLSAGERETLSKLCKKLGLKINIS
ncbi:MAG: MarR family transcriptional regulator [Deltaproteobacteria bacterium]|nr:MarR family transcriptional regulator [Deltaproteobacteria bacterium]